MCTMFLFGNKLLVLGGIAGTTICYNTFPYWFVFQDHPIRKGDEYEVGEEEENIKAGKC